MTRIVWIGRRRAPPALVSQLASEGFELVEQSQVAAALALEPGPELAVVVVHEGADPIPDLKSLAAARPRLPVLLATAAGVPRSLVLALAEAGGALLEFRTQTRAEILATIQASVERGRRARRERAVLARLHTLNEDFLKQVVAAQKRNLELERQLQPDPASGDGEGPARILIVDDEEVVRGVLERILSRAGYLHAVAATGEAAAQLLQRERFDLVVTDKNLPGMSGLELLAEIKRSAPGTDVVLMTGYASVDSAIEALNLGAAAYLEKPFEHVQVVRDRIDEVLARRRERDRHRRYLLAIKERNGVFLEQYRAVRADLEAWLRMPD